MGKIGVLGDIAFTVSDNVVETIKNMQWSGKARYSTHKRHLSHALTEFTGLEPDGITFEIQLSAYLGVDPMAELVKIWDYERSAATLPLVLGDKAYGKYRWCIESHKVKMEDFDKEGNLLTCTVSISLLEYIKD